MLIRRPNRNQVTSLIVPPADPDADARRVLRHHRAFATGLLVLMAALTLGTYALPAGEATDLLQAAAKAGFVGGIADWFAVTALFRHPLGIPIPHTAIVPARKDRVGRTLGAFVQRNFLSREVIVLASRTVNDNSELIRQRIEQETPWWVPAAIDDKIFKRVLGAIQRLLTELARDPHHPLRARFDESLRRFVERLNTSPELAARVDAWKEEFLDNEAARRFSLSLWQEAKDALSRYVANPESAAPGVIERGLTTFGQKALHDEELLAKLDDFAINVALYLVSRYQDEVGELIATTVASWDPELTSKRVELAIGRDLQFIRINGTIVGGLAGLVIYIVSSMFK